MPKYIVLGNWTDQGIRTAKDSVDRSHAARSVVEGLGGKMETIYWTLGAYDFVSITEAPDDASIVAALLKIAGAGNVRTQTLRAFDEGEMTSIIAKAS
jgi:uncharacterized protein with GYD domain